MLTKHKEDCLIINGKQSVKVEEGTIEFENYIKQVPVPFKTYADFKCNLKGVENYEGSYAKKYQDHILCSFAYKDGWSLVRQLPFLEVKMLPMNLLKQFLRKIITAKK